MARHARRTTLLSQLSVRERWALGGTAALAGLALMVAAATPAQAESPVETGGSTDAVVRTDGALGPATFAGTAIVATTAGDVVVEVESGQLLPTAARIRADVAAGWDPAAAVDGTGGGDGTVKAGGCRDWANAVASPFGYASSTAGCAVLGYPGYQRVYNWSNGSDVQMCVRAKSFSGASQGWTSIGCQGNRDFFVPWGNTFATTQVQAKSLSGVTGAAYIWWD